ncbi:putative surface protein with fasciclin (FAS1) repeats [Dyadobacter sp. BE34]|uniref:Surface protein with fasciclin (FAS1) repeats n=1 Tax=Dyadobacter fermentans TaxID=94254 RepID=A0ABU1QQD3_9BACT|nr:MULTISPECIES: fasciclin domain-containing protein [Dyadobacter]MDR6803340.1 putative surface protein with fasciclin (FAS1) repeats [Dyadobacter fermentans]MDR7041081.1 putative surface protein with fasciclin (FAS1) repeats [Dyadobacter sp. BE242]MDR7195484.1 putative surface protein with fasciclin (FAS1) repeats [Dyadobacter sp. BE34]MDR7213971.1 putative surface protein with fasciclin (FAS1) repeats [Dyadobacter sp. BE31]MDR7260891.1 putative surface protein with fasciclin (FAS1) repeats [
MKKNRFGGRWATFFLAAGLFSTILISCKEDKADMVGQKTVSDVIRENPEFSILKELVIYTEGSDALKAQDATFFLPSDAAFNKAKITSASQITHMPKDTVRDFLNSHVLKGLYSYAELKPGKYDAVYKKFKLEVAKKDTSFTINGSEIARRNVNASNAIIQIVDSLFVKVK